MIDLSGKAALVTGSSRGIGRACALRLAEAGADVIVNYVTSRRAAEEVAREIVSMGRRAVVVKADVSEEEDVTSMMDFVKDSFGVLDIIVSNAATGGFRPLIKTTSSQFEAAMRTNVSALIFLVRAATPLLERSAGRARVIVLSSHGAEKALPMYGLIGSTKAALESLTRHFALELGDRGINFNIIRAGLVETDSTRLLPEFDSLIEEATARALVGDRSLKAHDVADVALYLASPLSDMIQGQILVVDGGVGIQA